MRNTIISIDPIQMSDEIIYTWLLDVEIGIKDKFCDVVELQAARNMVMPVLIATFFAGLFNVDIAVCALSAAKMPQSCAKDGDETSEDDDKEGMMTKVKWHQILTLFQVMFCDLCHGSKCTPFHIMNSAVI